MLKVDKTMKSHLYEELLQDMINPQTINYLVDESCERDELTSLLESVLLMISEGIIKKRIRIGLAGKAYKESLMARLDIGKDICAVFEYVDPDDADGVLSYLLGSDVYITADRENITQINEFKLPIVVIQKENSYSVCEECVCVRSDVNELFGALSRLEV